MSTLTRISTTRRPVARPGTPDDRAEDDALFREYRTTGDRQVRNQLIDRHRWLAIHCAKRFADKGEPLDDLVQVGMLGVLKAVERFDPDYGAAFATFAVPTIVGELRRHFRDTTWAVHVPRRAKDLQHTIKVAVDELGQLLGRSPTVAEIAGHAGVRDEDVLDAIEAGRCYRKTPLETASDDATGARRRHRRPGRGRPWPRRRRGHVDGRAAARPSCRPANDASSSCATCRATRSRASPSWSGSARSRCPASCGPAWRPCVTR